MFDTYGKTFFNRVYLSCLKFIRSVTLFLRICFAGCDAGEGRVKCAQIGKITTSPSGEHGGHEHEGEEGEGDEHDH